MWNKLQELSHHPTAVFLKKLIGDPVQLYAVFLVTTVMHYYHSDMAWLYTVIAVFVSWLMMRFYDFVASHGWLGSLTYLIYLFAGLQTVGLLTTWGQQSYPISFLVWFLTPQGVVAFSGWYTVSIYLLMLGFLTSSVYYFSKIRYRMSMQFLIMLIPLSLYAKEGIQMPAVLVIILLASYFLLMIYCRQIHNQAEIRYLPSFHGSMSIAVYVLLFSIAAAIVPKPTITADREFIENAMSYSSWSDVLMNAISMFTDSTDNTVGTSNNARTVYYASSSEPLRLRTQTYSYYLENDSWNVIRDYDYPDKEISAGALTYKPQELLQAILDAGSLDTDFAETYQLSEFIGTALPEQETRTLSLYTLYPMQVLPSPTRTSAPVFPSRSILQISETDTFRGSNINGWSQVQYYPDSYALYRDVCPILKKLSGSEYLSLLQEAQGILQDTSPEQAGLLAQAQQECSEAYAYLQTAHAQDFQSEVITRLAEQITDGLTSDFDKAMAIEDYFLNEGFVYDQSYQKARGENAETFLTQSKTGVCYEYATAMVMLCRSIGLPARYVQGYNMSEMYDRNIQGYQTNFVIKVRDAHAFPEVYISGYGWCSFEPTVPSMEDTSNQEAENRNVMRWGFVLLGFAVIAGLVYIYLPQIRESLFRKRIVKLTPSESAAAVFRHMCQLMHLPSSTTVNELAGRSSVFCPESTLFDQINILLYGQPENLTSQQLALLYQNWHDCRVKYLKEQAEKRRQQAKAKRKNSKNA